MANMSKYRYGRMIQNESKKVYGDAYEGGQGGGNTSGSNYLMTTMDYYQVVGKHIDVDSLISLLENHNADIDSEISPQDQKLIYLSLNATHSSMRFGYNVCSGGVEIEIFDTPLENLEVAYTFRTILTTNKEKIESFEITEDIIKNMIDDYITNNIVINNLQIGYYANRDYLTIQEALSIFK